MDLTHEYTTDVGHRFKYLSWALALAFLLIAGRLYYLQVVKGKYYHFFSEQNSIKDIKIPALRGAIYDRNGEVIVDNRPAFDVSVIPQYVRDKPKVVKSLSRLLSMSEEDITKKIDGGKGFPSYYPIVIKSDISDDEVSSIKAHKLPWYDETDEYDLRGVDIDLRYARVYPDPLASSHLLGYIREIDAPKLKQFEKDHPGTYNIGDFVGIGGVEELADLLLRGADGFDQRVVNAIGREVLWTDIDLIKEEPKNGASLKLTLDQRLQRVAKEAFGDRKGALVALDPRNGEVLAMYSSPSMDLNKLSSPEGGKYWTQLANDPEKPLYNRPIQGTYPPASTYKIVTAAAGLGEGEITKESRLPCAGGLNFGGRRYLCWRKSGHGSIDVKTALTVSCDTFFYQLGLRLGVDKIAKYANKLGLGILTGIDIPREKAGLIPTSEWKMERFKQPWQAGENISISVGQGYNAITPIESAVMIATIANGGKKVVPHTIREAVSVDGKRLFSSDGLEKDMEQVLDEQVVSVIKEGLEGVVNTPGGTGHRLSSLKLKIAGKTGTAQVISREQWKAGVEKLKDHAWFVGYAPYDNPVIAVSAIVENGGFGASAAAPIVGKVIQEYLWEEQKNTSTGR